MNPGLILLAITSLLVVAFVCLRSMVRILKRLYLGRARAFDENVPDPAINLVLVHGTFSPNAPWTKQDSDLCRSLRSTLQGEVNIHAVRWSGLNSYSARRRAATKLKSLICLLKSKNRDAPLFVIGHSHGGNITMSALQDIDQALVDGVVTISTPFLHAEIDPPRGILRNSIGALAWALMTFTWVHILVGYQLIETHQVSDVWAGLVILLLVLPAAAIQGLIEGKAKDFAEQDTVGDAYASKTLILRTSADEASLLLGVSALVGWATSAVYRLAFWMPDALEHSAGDLWRFVKTNAKLLWLAYAVACSVATLGVLIEPEQGLPFAILIVVLFSPLLALGIFNLSNFFNWGVAIMVFMVIAAPLPIVLGLIAALAVGKEAAPYATIVRVFAEPTPPGKWTLQYLPAISSDVGGAQAALRHSRLYNDPVAIALIADWLNRFLTRPQR